MRNLVFFLSLMLFAGCGHDGYEEIRKAERLFDENPTRAVEICDSLEKEVSPNSTAKKARFVLIKQLARHKEWKEIELDSVFMEAVAYTNQKGSANEKLLANYLLGYAYTERDFLKNAQEAFLHATELADTTRSDCDFTRLAKTYGQMAALYQAKAEPSLIEEVALKGKRFAHLAGDSLLALDCVSQIANALFYEKDYKNSIELYKELEKKYLELKDSAYSKMMSRMIGLNYVKIKNSEQAAEYIKKFESNGFNIDTDGSLPFNYGYYATKGLYFDLLNETDSAAYYYYKQYSLLTSSLKFL